MNDMRFQLDPDDGFWSWDELVNVITTLQKTGWKEQIIVAVGGIKIYFKKPYKALAGSEGKT